MVFRNCLGMIASVSMLIIGMGAATPVSVVNLSIVLSSASGLGIGSAAGLPPRSAGCGAGFKRQQACAGQGVSRRRAVGGPMACRNARRISGGCWGSGQRGRERAGLGGAIELARQAGATFQRRGPGGGAT